MFSQSEFSFASASRVVFRFISPPAFDSFLSDVWQSSDAFPAHAMGPRA